MTYPSGTTSDANARKRQRCPACNKKLPAKQCPGCKRIIHSTTTKILTGIALTLSIVGAFTLPGLVIYIIKALST